MGLRGSRGAPAGATSRGSVEVFCHGGGENFVRGRAVFRSVCMAVRLMGGALSFSTITRERGELFK